MSKRQTNIGSPGLRAMNSRTRQCRFCNDFRRPGNIRRHEKSCKDNPENLKECPVCKKNYVGNSKTCGHSCANTYFRSGKNNGRILEEKDWSYQRICFKYHKKECIICGENKIVAAHHYDNNHKNNDPSNLVPLCPTHHSYMHSKYKTEFEKNVDEYVKQYLSMV